MGVLTAADGCGIGVPGKLWVIGFDDMESAALLGLSTVREPLENSGAEGARRLCALLREERVSPLRQQLALEVVRRSSTASFRMTGPPTGPATARAVRGTAAAPIAVRSALPAGSAAAWAGETLHVVRRGGCDEAPAGHWRGLGKPLGRGGGEWGTRRSGGLHSPPRPPRHPSGVPPSACPRA